MEFHPFVVLFAASFPALDPSPFLLHLAEATLGEVKKAKPTVPEAGGGEDIPASFPDPGKPLPASL
jgi:hypothetical protein